MVPDTGTMSQRQPDHRPKGIRASQIIRKREVCLQRED